MKGVSTDVKIESIIADIVLTIITLGIWNLWVQLRQIYDVNQLLGQKKFPESILKLLFFTLITLGFYFIYHEIMMTRALHRLNYGKSYFLLNIIVGFLTFFGLWFIVDSYQQNLLNRYIENQGHKHLQAKLSY